MLFQNKWRKISHRQQATTFWGRTIFLSKGEPSKKQKVNAVATSFFLIGNNWIRGTDLGATKRQHYQSANAYLHFSYGKRNVKGRRVMSVSSCSSLMPNCGAGLCSYQKMQFNFRNCHGIPISTDAYAQARLYQILR